MPEAVLHPAPVRTNRRRWQSRNVRSGSGVSEPRALLARGGSAAATGPAAAAARRLLVLGNLLATRRRFGAALLFGARSREQVVHRVVALVAPVLEVAVALFARNRPPHRARRHVG